jgi:MbtH protein
MSNPFDQTDSDFLALINDEDQYSLWPSAITVPSGWRTALGPASRDDCLNHIEGNWTDMRPRSLRNAVDPLLARIGKTH